MALVKEYEALMERDKKREGIKKLGWFQRAYAFLFGVWCIASFYFSIGVLILPFGKFWGFYFLFVPVTVLFFYFFLVGIMCILGALRGEA